jgi:GDPmannose 4,6-dehydratase
MLQRPEPEDLVIATGKAHSLRHFVELGFARLGMDWQAHVDLDEGLIRPTDIAHSRGCADKAHRVLGWRARHSLSEVIDFMIAAEQGRSWPVLAA